MTAIEGYRHMPGWRKSQRVDELNALTRSLALAEAADSLGNPC